MMFGGIDRIARRRLRFKAEAASRNYWQTINRNMRKTDMCKKGYCIICHRDNQELSDEHVIPEAIGGCYHIYNANQELAF